MARPRKVIDELAAQIQKLPRAEQVSVLDRVLTLAINPPILICPC
jgi:hypothetical protein